MTTREVGRHAGTTVACLVAGFAVVVVCLTVIAPRLVGGSTYTILTGSMSPQMPPGTVVVVRPKPADQIATGDVVTYQLTSGDPTVVTHRVVAEGFTGDGQLLFTTQGDANSAPDSAPVRAVQIKGVRWYAVPYIGRLTVVLNGQVRALGLLAVILGLVGYSAFMFAGALRDRFRTGVAS